jgi:hypothetical protein
LIAGIAPLAAAASLPAAAASVTHSSDAEWLLVAVPLIGLALVCAALVVFGKPATPKASGHPFPFNIFDRAAASLERITGLPAWSAAGVGVLHWALLVAGIGFMWDVAWHIDLGRDNVLFTPAHVMILLGIGAIGAAGGISIFMATLRGAGTRWHLGPVRIPRGAAALLALGIGATAGFPLDDIWHANYGVDVTMWGPTHLLMIGGASLAPIAGWLLLAEAGRDAGHARVRRILWTASAGILLVGLSTFQLEFDDGVPQWQALYQPVLIAMAATLGLVTARTVLGRGAAVRATVTFVAIRTGFALLVGPGLGHVVPRFPMYIGIALCVEVAFHLARNRSLLTAAVTAGILSGTAGLASEWGFSYLWGRMPWQPVMLSGIWAAALGALAAAVLGAALAAVLTRRGAGVPLVAVGLAAAAAVVALAVPFPRNTAEVTATLRTSPAGPSVHTIDRFNRPSSLRPVNVQVDVSQPDVMRGADVLEVNSWQGGGLHNVRLLETRPGHWRGETAVITGGAWKTIVYFSKADLVMALPVSMPADLEYGQAPIPVSPVRTGKFVAASKLLMREAHGGAAWPAMVAYSVLALVVLGWLSVIAAGAASISRQDSPPAGPRAAGSAATTAPRRRSRIPTAVAI